MAFINENGMNISYDCSALMEKLKKDIVNYGGDSFVSVRTVPTYGVTIYKDYVLCKEDAPLPELGPMESWKKMTASALMVLYEAEKGII